MSFVGPVSAGVKFKRYKAAGYITKHPRLSERLQTRPGLTGLATIYIPKDASPHRKFRYDLFYIRRQSICLDLHLIALSFWISFRGKWETRSRKI